MTPLRLSGRVLTAAGFNESDDSRIVLRLHDLKRGTPTIAKDAALIRELADLEDAHVSAYATSVAVIGDISPSRTAQLDRVICLPEEFAYLSDGDVIAVDLRRRRIRTLYRRASAHNSFLVTERCNHYCLMCSQPPKDVDDGWILEEIEAALPLLDRRTESIGFTGGEPLLDPRRMIAILQQAVTMLPQTEIHVLTNGRAFADRDVVAAWAGIGSRRLCAAIPIYSSVDAVHDHVVQAHGAFNETLMGILRMKDARQRIEVRLVLHALTVPGLVATCAWLARNLPFVDHVALMGLENTGFAIANHDLLWIDPVDYQADLARSVDILDAAGMAVSVYNLPLCVLDRSIWRFAVQSISDWKNAFLPVCEGCSQRRRCSGFFSSGRPRFSRAVRPLTEEEVSRQSPPAPQPAVNDRGDCRARYAT